MSKEEIVKNNRMREIKFRAWDKSLNKYHYPKLWDNSMPSNWQDWYILEQFTGLKDKNGVDIYEGDIIEWEYDNTPMPCIGVVEYNSSMACFSIPMDNNGQFPLSMEIIGNIHQSPELLTGKI